MTEHAIRLAAYEDYEACAQVKLDAVKRFGSDYQTRPLSQEVFAEYMGQNGAFVATDAQGRIAGYALAAMKEGDFYLYHMFVSSAQGRRGIGGALMRHIYEIGRKYHPRAVALLTSGSAPWNAPFYARHGFRVVNEENLPAYLADYLAVDRTHFDPSFPWVKNNPLILPRVAMRREYGHA